MAESGIKRVYVEKKAGFDGEAKRLRADVAAFLGASWPALAGLELRIVNRYDVSGLDEAAFQRVTLLVLSEPQCDLVYDEQGFKTGPGDRVFAVEYLPGQYDQRSDSAEQCAELVAGRRPRVRHAKVYVLRGGAEDISQPALDAVKNYLINPVDSREASLEIPSSLDEEESPVPAVPVLGGFISASAPDLRELADRYGLAMPGPDLEFCRDFFSGIKRDPTLAELRVLDTYWSDHCRHTTFTTALDEVIIEDGPLAGELRDAWRQYGEARKEAYPGAADRPYTLMDLATIGARVLKKRGLLADLDESREINACSLKINVEFEDGSQEPWLLLFKNETHNHPTEIEPFGGAATCLGGAIRDPLSGRAYVYGAMRVSGGGDPRTALAHTLPGKLPQIKIAREAAAGYASYGNQIGIATAQVAEFYHSGFTAKRMELGAVMGAAPARAVRRENPRRGDLVLLIGGKTGRDGIGGATGSSKVHTGESVETAGAEVQKGNAVEERKLQRLFRNPEVSLLIKRCNDFGAGGVAVAVGELAPGLDIDLDAVPKKYAGLDGIELAISESQERMAVVVSPEDAEKLIALAAGENLEAVVIARVSYGEDEEAPSLGTLYDRGTEKEAACAPHLRMRWRGQTIVDLSRTLLDSHGAPRKARVLIRAGDQGDGGALRARSGRDGVPPNASLLLDDLERELRSLRGGSRRGLQERFDGSIGASSVLFPWGGASQGTPECGLAMLIPALDKTPLTAGVMSFGYDPDESSRCPYTGAKGAVKEALAKFACLGGDPFGARLSLQEYFERAGSPASWGRPLSALLGALEAQLALGVPAIGGKDSMSGSYRDAGRGIELAVPPTLVAFAAGAVPAKKIRSGALSGREGNIILAFNAAPLNKKNEWEVFRANLGALLALSSRSLVRAAFPVPAGGALAALALMAFGNMSGVEAEGDVLSAISAQGSFLVEVDRKFEKYIEEFKTSLSGARWSVAGKILSVPVFRIITGSEETLAEEETPEQRTAGTELEKLRLAYEYPLSQVYPQTSQPSGGDAPLPGFVRETPRREGPRKTRSERRPVPPLVVLPVFPGTNCEWDMERAFVRAGARVRQVVFRNLSSEAVRESSACLAGAIEEAQIVALSGGFSAGDEPDGSGKFIANVFRSSPAADALSALLEKRDGLVLGICNGFQALIKLGLVPRGRIGEADAAMPALTYNNIGRHVSRMVRTVVMSASSPWLALEEPGTVHILPVSHGEGRVVIGEEEAKRLFASGQIAFCYADAGGRPAGKEPDNPNGSDYAIEGMTSPDGRVLGKMGHSERRGNLVHINIPGNKYQRIFEAGVAYFT